MLNVVKSRLISGKKLLLVLILYYSFLFANCFAQTYEWVDISANLPGDTLIVSLSDVSFINDNEGWFSTFHPFPGIGRILHTTDGGATFDVQTTQLYTNAIYMLNANEGYSGGWSGFVYRTTDGGLNWAFHGTIGATLSDISFPPSGGTAYACGDNGAISSITSSAVTPMNSGVPDDLSSISFPVNSTEGWVCGGSIIRHYTGGAWVGDQFKPSGGYNAIYMVDTLNGWAVGDNGIIIHTTDGHIWTAQTNPSSNSLFDVFFLNTQEGWAVGVNGTILHTTNGGTNWLVEGAGLTGNFLTGVHFTSSTNGYVSGNDKTLLKYTQSIGITPIPGTLPEDYALMQNYPNPFNPTTTIKFTISNIRLTILKVYNVLGNEVAVLVNEKLSAGSYEVEFNAGNIPSGVYFYQLQAGDYAETRKMVLIR